MSLGVQYLFKILILFPWYTSRSGIDRSNSSSIFKKPPYCFPIVAVWIHMLQKQWSGLDELAGKSEWVSRREIGRQQHEQRQRSEAQLPGPLRSVKTGIGQTNQRRVPVALKHWQSSLIHGDRKVRPATHARETLIPKTRDLNRQLCFFTHKVSEYASAI